MTTPITAEPTTPVAAKPSIGGMFRPINDVCLDCKKDVKKHERQELGWDENNQTRRRCGECINKKGK
jgi:hypothetical protein